MPDTKFWKKYFEVYDLLNELIPYRELLEEIVDRTAPKPGSLILDAGTGTGNLAIILASKGARVVGLDSSPEGLEVFKKKLPNEKAVVGDLTKPLQFSDNLFDSIVSNNVIYALPLEARPPLFKEFHRVLKPNGQIVIANVKKSFKPLAIYIDHLKLSVKQIGILWTILKAFKLLLPTLKIFYYNSMIKKENSKGNYSFMANGEQESLLKSSNFREISEPKVMYAGQSILVSAEK